MLCAIPALRALRRAHPAAHIALIGMPAGRWLIERFDMLVDALIPFPGFPGIPERPYSPAGLEKFLRRSRAAPFDLAIQMHGSGRVSNAFTAMLGARGIAGCFETETDRPARGDFFPYPRRGSEVHRCLFLTRALRCPSDDDGLAFPLTRADRRELESDDVLNALPRGGFICLHAGARDPARRWPVERFARAGDALAGHGYSIVLTGTVEERAAADAVQAAMRQPAINAAGRTSLGAAAALLERSALLVTNDTGVSHVAASLATPSVVVFLASDPDRWAPIDRARHRPVVARGLVPGDEPGMRRSASDVPEVDEVLHEATALLNGIHGRKRTK